MSKKDKKIRKKERAMRRVLNQLSGEIPKQQPVFTLAPPVLPNNVVPENAIAMDASPEVIYGAFPFGVGFVGYPQLAELAQISEYRAVAETTAKEMTREWIEIQSAGEDNNHDKISQIEQCLIQLKAQKIFCTAIETEHLFGRAQILLKLKGHDGDKLANPLVWSNKTIAQGSLKALVNIEPMWTSPASANTTDPTEPDFYQPRQWYVMGKPIHATRMFTLISRPVPDMLKPAYNFSGVSMSQLMMPYVNRWLRNVNSVSDLLNSFSTSGIKTDMSGILSGGCDSDSSIQLRADLYNRFRDNRGLMLLDKEAEEFFQFNAPLSTLDALLAQSQEQMSAPSHTPLVKLLGITPSGLNASSEGEIAVYYDYIKSLQESMLREPLDKLIKLVQLHLFGEIDDNITFDFKPLAQLSEMDKATIRKTDCDIDVAYMQNGVVADVEVRKRIAFAKDSGYNGIDVDGVPESPDDDFSGSLNDENPPAQDSDNNWDESQHPRDENGRFGSGSRNQVTQEKSSDVPMPEVKGDELGTWSSMKELRDKAKEYAKRFVGQKFVNAETGREIEVSMSGVKHTISGAQDSLIKTIPVIPDIVKTAKFLHAEEPKKEDSNVISVEKYYSDVKISGETHRMLVTVKHHTDGRRYYDHGFYVGKV